MIHSIGLTKAPKPTTGGLNVEWRKKTTEVQSAGQTSALPKAPQTPVTMASEAATNPPSSSTPIRRRGNVTVNPAYIGTKLKSQGERRVVGSGPEQPERGEVEMGTSKVRATPRNEAGMR